MDANKICRDFYNAGKSDQNAIKMSKKWDYMNESIPWDFGFPLMSE